MDRTAHWPAKFRGTLNLTPDGPPKPNLSRTSIKRYGQCRRQWALHYETERLKEFDRPLFWKVLREKRLMAFELLAGQVVDDTITAALCEFARSRTWPDSPFNVAMRIVGEYITHSREFATLRDESRKGPWPRSDRQPIDRYYFGEQIREDEKASLRETIRQCLDNFEKSEIKQTILAYPPDTWKLPTKARGESERDAFSVQPSNPWYMDGNVPMYANYDFMIVAPDRTLIFDWKTGKERMTEALEQLHCYAAYAHSYFQVPYEQISLLPVWLTRQPQHLTLEHLREPVEEATLASLRCGWAELYAELSDKHAVYSAESWRLFELFPLAENPECCRRCQFRSCSGYSNYLHLHTSAPAAQA